MSIPRQKRPVQNNDQQEDTSALIEEYQQNPNETLHNELVNRYTNLVERLALKFARGNESYEDLVQVGMIGLLAAFKRFEKDYGRQFEGFAIPTIIGEMKRYMRDKTWSVQVPRRIKELGPRIKKAVDVLTAENKRSPQVAEIATYLNVAEEEVLESMEMARSYHALSVDRLIEADRDGSTVTLLDLIGQEDSGYDRIDLQLTLQKALLALNERERQIIQMTFFENLSQKQVGEALGISQMHVSRIQRRALQKLQKSIHLEKSECT